MIPPAEARPGDLADRLARALNITSVYLSQPLPAPGPGRTVVDVMGRALAPGIRVVSVAPGLVAGAYMRRLDPAWSEAQRANTPLERLTTPDEVAAAVYTAAAHLTFSTGCIIPVDGGRALGHR